MIPANHAMSSDSHGSSYASVCSKLSPLTHSADAGVHYGFGSPNTDTNYSYLQESSPSSWRQMNPPSRNDWLERHTEMKVPGSTDQNSGARVGAHLVPPNCDKKANSPISVLFDHMYKNSVSSGSEPKVISFKNSGGSFSDAHSVVNGRTDSPRVVGEPHQMQMHPLRSCSSQGDLSYKYVEMRMPDVLLKGGEVLESAYISPNYHAHGALSSHQEKFPEQGIIMERVPRHRPEEIVFQHSPLPNAENQKYQIGPPSNVFSPRIYPQDHRDVAANQDFVESEEPLPCDLRMGQTGYSKDVNRTDIGSPAIVAIPALPALQDLKDVQLTVFMKDVASNKSFDIGAKMFVNKPSHRLPGDGRSGSMPYRVKRTTSPTMSKPVSPIRAMGIQDRPEQFLAMPSEHRKVSTVLHSPDPPKGSLSVSVSHEQEGQNDTPVYTGPRLIPMEKIRDNADDDSLLRSTLEAKDKTSALRLAKRLFNLDGFRKSEVAKHLGKRSEFAQLVREAYLQQFEFSSSPLDVALRDFLTHLVLSGETQERERILAQFSQRFVECNPNSFGSQESCHVLVCSIMLLNTDLHGENGRKKMTVHEFVENLSGLNGGANFPKDLLKNIYQSIKNQPIEFQVDEAEVNPDAAKDEQVVQPQANPFLDVPDPSKAHEFKTGYLMRKCCLESDGHRTPMGKRGWKMFRASLRDLILYLHKDEHGFNCGTTFDDTSNAVRIHHALATVANDYAKRHDVFRLRTADWAEYLFQAGDSQECQSWIDVINQVAAAFSAPPLPGAVGSQAKFQRPLMPSSCTRLPLKDQLSQHLQTLAQIEKDLGEHREFCPEKGSKPRVIQDYLEKETFLEFEHCRFQAYCKAIQKLILSNFDEDEPLTSEGYFERTKCSQGSFRSLKQPSPKDRSDILEYDGKKKSQMTGIASTAGSPLYHGLHPAKSVPALLFESRV